MLICAEDMFFRAQNIFDQVCDYLGLRRIDLNPPEIQNAGLERGNESEIVDSLVPYYADLERELRKLDLCDFGWELYE